MFDLAVIDAVLPDGRDRMTLACQGGRIATVERELRPEARQTVDAKGQLVSPPFVDAHFHMDSALTYGMPRVNRSGTLLEGIQLWSELKPSLTHETIRDRALALCRWSVARGTLLIRSHVDVCDPDLRAVKALLEVRELVRNEIDLQLVAFPQDGYLRWPEAERTLAAALDMGVDVVGARTDGRSLSTASRQGIRDGHRAAREQPAILRPGRGLGCPARCATQCSTTRVPARSSPRSSAPTSS